MASRKIALYGNFGTQNIGNECTLQTVIENVKQRLPEAQIYCICSQPETVARDHAIPAIPLSSRVDRGLQRPKRRSKAMKAARILYYTLPMELLDLYRSWRRLRGTTELVVTGTGVLEDDDAETRSWMMSLLRWTVSARLRGARVVFLSVGAGPIPSRFARTVTKLIFGLAHYVSYRDTTVKQYMESIGLDTARHRVYPDVAFGLSLTQAAAASPGDSRSRRVGVGVVDATKFETDEHYRAYLWKLSTFVLWLLDRGYDIRVIHGDALFDRAPLEDFISVLRERGIAPLDTRVVVPDIHDVRDLLRVMDDVSIVVASRYHNIILNLALGKPAIGLSYHFKFSALLADFGMADYCREVRAFDPEDLARRFEAMVAQIPSLEREIRTKTSEMRTKLDEQYRLILGLGAPAA